MTQEQKNWYDFGYEQQCSRCPLLDHVWGGPEYPIELQKYYRQGQVQAFLDEKAERPGFYTELKK